MLIVDARSDHFMHVLESTGQTHLEHGNRLELLANGDRFYPAMLDAIRSARETINMETYIFKKGAIGDAFVEALCERARAGVRVTLVMDAIGSFGAFRKLRTPLRAAGARVAVYQTFTWYRLSRLNNRTHRELLVVDGETAFVGGAGIADWWAGPTRKSAARGFSAAARESAKRATADAPTRRWREGAQASSKPMW